MGELFDQFGSGQPMFRQFNNGGPATVVQKAQRLTSGSDPLQLVAGQVG